MFFLVWTAVGVCLCTNVALARMHMRLDCEKCLQWLEQRGR